MRKQLSDNLFFFIGLVVALFTSIILWIIGEDKVSTIILGLNVTILGLLIETLLQVRAQQQELIRTLGVELELKRDEWLHARIVQIITDYNASLHSSFPLLRQKAQMAMENFAREMNTFSRGTYYDPIEREKQEILAVMKLADSSIKATSYVDMHWWTSESGEEYLQEHLQVLRRGCVVNRVFYSEVLMM